MPKDAVILKSRRGGRVSVIIPSGRKGFDLLNYLLYEKGYQYSGSGVFIIEKRSVRTVVDKAKELGLEVEFK